MPVDLRISDVLGREGVLSRRLPGFRERPQQVRMAEEVAGASRGGGHLLVEAPTGVGKSLAYLVPVLLECVAQGRKVVISTHTITLQDQLLEKDLPLLAASLPVEFTACKAVGRTNYLGLRRLHLALESVPSLVEDDPEVLGLRRLLEWAGTTDEGLRQELAPPPPSDIWEAAQSEGDNCLGRRCPSFEQCFFQAARRRLLTSDIIVTNHALYFTDLMLRRDDLGVLPPHDVLILDEAHHVEHVAAEHFGLELSRRGLLRLLSRLAERRGTRGLLHRLEGPGRERAVTLVGDLRRAARGFFDAVAAWCADHPGSNGRIRDPAFVKDGLTDGLQELADRLEELAASLDREEARVEVEAFAQRAAALAETVPRLLAVDNPDLVYFVQDAENPRRVALVARPLDVAPILRTELFGRLRSVVMTSATLAAGASEEGLAYTARRLGCEGTHSLVLSSPFDYADRVEIHVRRDLPLPDDETFEERVAEVVESYVRRTHGGAFVLFTSFRSLRALHARLAGPLSEEGLLVLAQGRELGRAELLRRFREDGNAVLFGTESFWQGVDVPGPALRLVVLTRLPFPVPTLPLNQARSEALRRAGLNPFLHYFLPEAVIRFRQGFGRLIRTEDDEGIVLCLDRRLLDRSYGRRFLEALPPCPRIITPAPGTPP